MQQVNQKSRFSFFAAMGLLGLFAVHVGFLKTFIAPQLRGTFHAPWVIYVHGSLAVSWVTLFFLQSLLISFHRIAVHRILGILGVLIAAGAAGTMPSAGLYQVLRDGDVSSLVGTVTGALMFSGFVAAGVLSRRDGPAHKRWMLLALILLLWPAWFRFRHFFPGVPRPDIWFAVVLADSLILLSWIWDLRANGRIHPVLLTGGLFIIAEHTFEVLAFDSGPWRAVASWLYRVLTN
ncbi:hypothetical protein ACWKWU_18810 [Chitinophaga lutea]